jgi:hypothetical protein
MALQVATGELTLNDALTRLMRKDKARKLVAKEGWTMNEALQIVDGMLSPEQLQILKELKKSPARQPDRSVLLDLLESGRPGRFHRFGHEPYVARVVSVEKYDCTLEDAAGEREELEKHELKLVAPTPGISGSFDSSGVAGTGEARADSTASEEATAAGSGGSGGPADAADPSGSGGSGGPADTTDSAGPTEPVGPTFSQDPEVGALGLGPSTRYTDRFRSSKRVLYRVYRDRIPIRVTFRDGEQVEGYVGWHGKYEFQLLGSPATEKDLTPILSPGHVVIFRHAMHRIDELAPAAAPAPAAHQPESAPDAGAAGAAGAAEVEKMPASASTSSSGAAADTTGSTDSKGAGDKAKPKQKAKPPKKAKPQKKPGKKKKKKKKKK